ncbi:MAG: hypothetical protein IPP33_02050 [Flavobacteriales bacterium]|nr:hypothetical protein [Flavobacteriales bacterium]
MTPATQRQWIINIDNPANWTAPLGTCAVYASTGINYVAGYTLAMIAGGYQPGYWLGTYSTNWFDCKNWDDAEVPTTLTNVRIGQTYGAVNNCQISGGTAYAQSATLLSGGNSYNLSIINGGVLQLGTGGVDGYRNGSGLYSRRSFSWRRYNAWH